MKEVKLTQGKVALVDDEDYEYVNQWKWCAHKQRNTFYAVRNSPRPNSKLIKMQNVIMNTENGMVADHIDRNGLNNQKYNLRVCNNADNLKNRAPSKNCTSIYKGVSKNGKRKKWKASITSNGVAIYLGVFATEVDAAHAYDEAAKKLHKEFAYLNFK